MFTLNDLINKLNELNLAYEVSDDSPYIIVYDNSYNTMNELLEDERIKKLQKFLDDTNIDYTWDADENNVAIFIELPMEDEYDVAESYVEDEPGKYTVWSASDLVESKDQIPLVKIETTDEGKLQAIAIGDDEFDKESHKIAQNVIDYAYNHGKTNPKDILVRIDKTLNHADPFFSVEFDRKVTNTGYELLAAQTLRTLRDDLKAVVNTKGASEQAIVDKYAELTGVDYYTDKVIDREQYKTILGLQGKKDDRFSYEKPDENAYMIRLKDLAENLIEKVLLKEDPDFYKR